MADVKCFVIGPIGDRNAPPGSPDRQRYEDALEVFESVIRPACEKLGLDPVRADKIATPGEITEQVCRHLRDDDVVIADVTDANPNVMYELGMRHTRDLVTVQIGEEGRLPFDISIIRTIRFRRDEYALILARDQLYAMLENSIAGTWDRLTPTRVWLEPNLVPALEGIPQTDLSTADAPGFLDHLAASEEALPRMTEHLYAIGNIVQQMGTLATENTPRMQSAPTSGAKLLVANEFATQLEPLAEGLEVEAGLYADSIKEVDPGVSYMLDRVEARDLTDEERQAAIKYLRTMTETGAVTRRAMESTASFADTISTVGSATRKLREPTARVARTLRRMIEATRTVENWSERAAALLRDMPDADAEPHSSP